MAKGLTDKQQRVLEFIRENIEQRGIPPSVREIQRKFTFKSPNAVTGHLRALSKKGYIEIESHTSRGIRVPGMVVGSGCQIPLITGIYSGVPILTVDNIEAYYAIDKDLFEVKPDFILKAPSDSMNEAGIYEGDFVLVQETEELGQRDIVVTVASGEISLRSFTKKRNKIRLDSANSDYPPIEFQIGKGNITIIGKVVGVIRKL